MRPAEAARFGLSALDYCQRGRIPLALLGPAFHPPCFKAGIVAKNGILVLDYYKQLRAQGVELVEALVQAGHRRLRPVLMTSLAAALGMLPLAYGVGTGAQMLQPLGIAVIGALFISVLLSLIATPVVYYLLRSMTKTTESSGEVK